MTDYAEFTDITKRYNPITTMIGSGANDVSTADVTSIYIRDAMSIVNAYLSRRYITPLNPEPILTDLTSDIAIYRMLSDRAPRIPDYMEKRYTNAMSMLTMLRDGGMDLTASSQSINSGGGDQFAWSNVIGGGQNGPVFKPIESETCGVASADRLTF